MSLEIFNFDLIIAFLIAGIFMFLGILVVQKAPKIKVNQYFALFTFFMGFWIVANFLENKPDIVGMNALEWMLRLDFAFSIMASYYLLMFGINFKSARPHLEKTWQKAVTLSVAILLALSAIFTDLMIYSIEYADNVINFEVGLLFFVFFAYVLATIGTAIVTLFVRYKKSIGLRRRALSYVISGLIISFTITILVNMVLQPLLHISADISRLGIYCFLILVGFTSYAIVKHRLMEFREVLRKGIIYVLLAAVLVVTYLLLALFFRFIIAANQGMAYLIAALIPALMFAFVIKPAYSFLERITRAMAKGSFDYSVAVDQLTAMIKHKIDVQKVMDNTLPFLLKTLEVSKISFLVLDKSESKFCVEKSVGENPDDEKVCINKTSSLVKFFGKHKTLIDKDEVQSMIDTGSDSELKNLKSVMNKLNELEVQIIVPVIKKNIIIGLVLVGDKTEKANFYEADYKLLDLYTSQLAVLIENSFIYQELKKEKERLEQKVEELEKFNQLVVNRELKMRELKNKLKESD